MQAKKCYRVCTIKRNPTCTTFEDEKPQPKISNLGTHIKDDHPAQWEYGTVSEPTANPSTKPQDHEYTRASTKIMADCLKEGSINPHKDPTERPFETLCRMAP